MIFENLGMTLSRPLYFLPAFSASSKTFKHQSFFSFLKGQNFWKPLTPKWCPLISPPSIPLSTRDRCLLAWSERLEKTSEVGSHTVPLPLLFSSCCLLSSRQQPHFSWVVNSEGAAACTLLFHTVGPTFQITLSLTKTCI